MERIGISEFFTLDTLKTSLYSEKVKFFKPTRLKLLFATLLSLLLLLIIFQEAFNSPVGLYRYPLYSYIFIELISFLFSYLIFSIAAKELSRVKSFKQIPYKLLLAALLPLCYLLFILPELLNTCTLLPCETQQYHLTTDLPYSIEMVRVAMERGVVRYIIFFQWALGFLLCYLIFSIPEVVYGALRKSKKALPNKP